MLPDTQWIPTSLIPLKSPFSGSIAVSARSLVFSFKPLSHERQGQQQSVCASGTCTAFGLISGKTGGLVEGLVPVVLGAISSVLGQFCAIHVYSFLGGKLPESVGFNGVKISDFID